MPEQQPSNVNDVAKPGTTQPSATSRPVIVGHGVTVTDPMVSEKPAAEPKQVVKAGSGSTKSSVTPSATAEAMNKEVASKQDKEQAETLQEKKPEPIDKLVKLNEMIETGDYNVTINKAHAGRRSTFVLTFVGVVLLAAVVVYILADLQVIDLGIKLPFEFFK